MSLRTPLSRVGALGAARKGTGHFWWQRMTGIAMLPLTVFLVRTGIVLAGADAATIATYFASPVNALLMIASAVIVLWHLQQGLQVVVEDYIQNFGIKIVTTILILFFCIGMAGLLTAYTIKLSIGG